MPQRVYLLLPILLLTLAWSVGSIAWGQPGAQRGSRDEERPLTIVRVELLTQGIDVSVNPQRWGQAFDDIGITCRVRQALADETAEVSEEVDGRIRRITLVGLLDRQGKIHFPDRAFTLADQRELRSFLADLARYGIQGNPEGQPNWGLNEEQLVVLLGVLATPITDEVQGRPWGEALASLPLPERMALKWSPAVADGSATVETGGPSAGEPARPAVSGSVPRQTSDASPGEGGSTNRLNAAIPVRSAVRGISLGTGLAILLSEQGLGFQPVRNPDGSIDLQIVPLGGDRKVWPIGWDLGPTTPRDIYFPKLFEFFPINIRDVPLLQTIETISERSGVPMLIDERSCLERDIDLSMVRVTVVERQSAWALIMGRLLTPARLTFDYRLDEADRGFLWIYPFVPQTPARRP